jgi:type I restriction enzyme, S subunit
LSFNADIAELVAQSEGTIHAAAPWWKRAPLGELVSIVNGFPFSSEGFSDTDGERLIRIRDVTTGDTATYFRGDVPEGYWVEPGDIVVGMDGDFNLRVWSAQRGLLNQRVCKLVPHADMLDRTFLAYALPGYLKLINDHTSSVTVKHLSSRTIQQIPFPLPPLAEQRRIVARIEALFARIRRARAELERVAPLTRRYRARAIAAPFAVGLEAGWPLQRFETLARDARVGLVRSKADQSDTGPYPYIRMQHYDEMGRWRLEKVTRVAADRREAQEYELKPGDLLFNTRNSVELVGKVAVWPASLPTHLFNNNLLRVRFRRDVNPDYVKWALMSEPALSNLANAKSATTSVAAIYQRDLMNVQVPLPPLETQNVVSACVSKAIESADQCEHEVNRALALLDRLEQSILARAFRGELVPQDPTDEPVNLRAVQGAVGTRAPRRGRRTMANEA